MKLEENLSSATHWWSSENPSVTPSFRVTVPWVFKTGEALFDHVRDLQEGQEIPPFPIQMSGKRNMVVTLPISSSGYFVLRGILAMTADLYRITEALLKSGDTANAKPHLNKIRKGANKFRSLRNFFDHIDDRLVNLDKHGVSGEHSTKCGIDYMEGTEECFHLIYDGTSFHFTDEKMVKERSFVFTDFKPIFEGLEGLYNEITSHKVHSSNYPEFTAFINYNELQNS